MRGWALSLAILIMLTAAGLRIAGLAHYPPGPHYDEAANLQITRTVAFGGARYFPMVENYQGREVLYFYLAAPFITLIHDSRFGLQVLGVYANLLMVAGAITLGRLMFPSKRGVIIGLAAGIAAAISLPQVLLARQAFRAIILPLMQTLTLLSLWRGLRTAGKTQWAWLIVGGLLGGASVYTYNSSRLFPIWLLIAGLALIALSSNNRRQRFMQGIVFFGMLGGIALPFAIYGVRNPDIFLGRLYEVTGTPESVTLTESITLHARMFFLHGETLLRYNPRGRPYFTVFEGGLLLIGFAFSLWGITRPTHSPLQRAALMLLLLSPLMVVPSVISTGGLPPNHMRSIAMIPLIFLLVGVGFQRVTARLALRGQFALLLATLIIGSLHTARDYHAWVTRADLYYETDTDLATAAAWLNTHTDRTVYVAAQDRFHPTVTTADTPPVRWLGRDSLFLPPPDDAPRLAIFPRSAPLPDDWREWLTNSGAIVTDLPLAPDGQTAFEALRLPADLPLPDRLHPANHPPRTAALQLLGSFSDQAFPNGHIEIVTAWQVIAPPAAVDLMPIVHLVDSLGNVIARGEVFTIGTDHWQAGETLLQRVPLRVPVGTPPAEYTLQMAWVARTTDTYQPYSRPDGSFAGVWASVGTLRVLRPNAFPPPDDLPADVRVNRDVPGGVQLIGWNQPPSDVRPGEVHQLVLYWMGIGSRQSEILQYKFYIDGNDGAQYPLITQSPMLKYNPSDTWFNGQLMTDRLQVMIDREQPPGAYDLLLEVGGSEAITIGQVRVADLNRLLTAPPVEHQQRYPFGAALTLYGWQIDRDGDQHILTLVWYARDTVDRDYTVFIHGVDQREQLLFQRDAQPVSATYPTSLWLAGEYIVDRYPIPNDQRAAFLNIGLYDPQTGERLVNPSTDQDKFRVNLEQTPLD